MNNILVMIANRAPKGNKFSFKDLAGSAGRLDVVCRVILSFQNTQIFNEAWIILRGVTPVKTLVIKKEKSNFHTEQEVATEIKNALNMENSKFGILEGDFKKILDILRKEYLIVALDESGTDIFEVNLKGKKYAFILGDDKGFNEEESIYINQIRNLSISLGRKSYLSSQAIAILDFKLNCMK